MSGSSCRGYSVAFARDMIPEKMKPYSSSLPPIYEKYQGRYLAIGGPGRGVDWLCGDWGDRMVMVGEFPTYKAVGAFWWGPEYRASAKLRDGAVTVDVGQVPGTDQAPTSDLTVFLIIVVPGEEPVAPELNMGSCLISVAPDALETLEGDLGGLSLSMTGFASRDDLDAAWAKLKPTVEAQGGRACAANRAPTA